MSFQAEKISTGNKSKFYKLLTQQVEGLLSVENNRIANAANLSALLFHSLEEVNWVGFYFYVESQKELVLGPFHGQVACTRIPVGKGVCGTAFESNTTQLIDDVHSFEGHIACDSASNSEIVIPLNINGETIGVLDIDSPIFSRFDKVDKNSLESIAQIYLNSLKEK
jgi:L-methionine (R)-S-oxide reductase